MQVVQFKGVMAVAQRLVQSNPTAGTEEVLTERKEVDSEVQLHRLEVDTEAQRLQAEVAMEVVGITKVPATAHRHL